MACPRHPMALMSGGRCPACLLDLALSAEVDNWSAPWEAFTVQIPLGRSRRASVFLVRRDGPGSRLLRLKVWHTVAPANFLQRFTALKTSLDEWPDAALVTPIAAMVDACGYPSVVSPFRQGLPMLDAVRAGGISPADAVMGLERLLSLTRRFHARGLVHGSIHPGNLLVARDAASACLLDFGMTALVTENPGPADPAEDLRGFAALARAFTHHAGPGRSA
jgi:hypothetical protein